MTEKELIELLQKTGALLTGHFLLSSGLHSDKHVQCAKLLQYPDLAECSGIALVEIFAGLNIRKPDFIASPAIGGIVIGQEVARSLNIRHIFIEKDDSGKPVLRRGLSVEPNEKFIVVEDVVTTGKSTKEVIDVLKAMGAQPIAAMSIINRSGKNEPIDGIHLISLATMNISTYRAEECPICAKGIPVEKPGSRKKL